MRDIHAVLGPPMIPLLAALAVGAGVMAARNVAPAALDWGRRALLVVLVAEAAIGLALAVRGAAPAEMIHWFYGVAVIAALLIPGSMAPEIPARRRSAALAAGCALAVLLVWRLGASG